MDLQTSFGFVKKYICGSNSFIGRFGTAVFLFYQLFKKDMQTKMWFNLFFLDLKNILGLSPVLAPIH